MNDSARSCHEYLKKEKKNTKKELFFQLCILWVRTIPAYVHAAFFARCSRRDINLTHEQKEIVMAWLQSGTSCNEHSDV